MNFNNLEELKDRLMPALKIKEEEFKTMGYEISSFDIWENLKYKWKDSYNLSLNEMVNDILKLEYSDITW